MLKWLSVKLGLSKPACQHPRAETVRWNETGTGGLKTPFVRTKCPDCGFMDVGVVYGDPWEDR